MPCSRPWCSLVAKPCINTSTWKCHWKVLLFNFNNDRGQTNGSGSHELLVVHTNRKRIAHIPFLRSRLPLYLNNTSIRIVWDPLFGQPINACEEVMQSQTLETLRTFLDFLWRGQLQECAGLIHKSSLFALKVKFYYNNMCQCVCKWTEELQARSCARGACRASKSVGGKFLKTKMMRRWISS